MHILKEMLERISACFIAHFIVCDWYSRTSVKAPGISRKSLATTVILAIIFILISLIGSSISVEMGKILFFNVILSFVPKSFICKKTVNFKSYPKKATIRKEKIVVLMNIDAVVLHLNSLTTRFTGHDV